jgi:hypothetical protein
MQFNSEIFEADSNKQLLRNTLFILIGGVLISLIFAEPRFALGLLIGGVIVFCNYFLLKKSLTRMFEGIVSKGQKPFFSVLTYALRYLVIGILLYLIYKTDIAPLTAVLVGLCSLAAAIFLEGILLIFKY